MKEKNDFFLNKSVVSINYLFTLRQSKREKMNQFFWTLGKILNGAWFYDNIGNIFNYACIVLGFFGLFYWLNLQKKFNARAENDPNQIK